VIVTDGDKVERIDRIADMVRRLDPPIDTLLEALIVATLVGFPIVCPDQTHDVTETRDGELGFQLRTEHHAGCRGTSRAVVQRDGTVTGLSIPSGGLCD
jgi:hypothetical protein